MHKSFRAQKQVRPPGIKKEAQEKIKCVRLLREEEVALVGPQILGAAPAF
jgi:hypothetical protein